METIAEPVADLLDRLTQIEPGQHVVVSCYLQLRSEDRERGRYRSEWRRLVHKIETDGTIERLTRDDRLAVERDLGRITSTLEDHATLPHARGVAIFACEALDLFEVIGLPRVSRSRLIVDDTPWVREVVAASEEFRRIIAVVLDRAHARLFDVSAAGAAELPCIPGGATRGGRFHSDRHGAPGWGERDYHQRIEEERHRHYARVVDAVMEFARTTPVRGLVVAGPLDSRTAFTRFLPRALAADLLGTTGLDPNTVTEAQVTAAATHVAESHERVVTGRLLESWWEALGSGWAVNGARDTLAALARGQLRVLLVREGCTAGGYRCSDTGRLVAGADECPGEGSPEPVRDIADEAVEEALRQRIEVVTLHDDSGSQPVDGIAGMLRFR